VILALDLDKNILFKQDTF